MKELPKNPNTRQPYSDVSEELTITVSDLCSFLRNDLDDYYKKVLSIKLKGVDQAILRARAVLDPLAITDTEWEQAKLTAWEIMIPLEEDISPIKLPVRPRTPDEILQPEEVVAIKIADAKLAALDKFEHALYHIMQSPSWRAHQIAEEATGCGPYWCRGFPKGDTSPKNLFAYYMRLPFRWMFQKFRVFWYKHFGSGSWPFPW